MGKFLYGATMLGAGSNSRGILAALTLATLLTAVVAGIALWKPEQRRSHYLPRLSGLFLLVFVVGLFRYGVLRLSNTVALGLLLAVFGVCVALDWRNRRRKRLH